MRENKGGKRGEDGPLMHSSPLRLPCIGNTYRSKRKWEACHCLAYTWHEAREAWWRGCGALARDHTCKVSALRLLALPLSNALKRMRKTEYLERIGRSRHSAPPNEHNLREAILVMF